MQRTSDIVSQTTNFVDGVTNSIMISSQPHLSLVPFCLIGLLILLLLVVVVLLLRRYLRSESANAAAPVEPGPDPLAPERERVLKLLDAGKITGQESADLLNALGHATPPRPVRPAAVAGPPRKLVLLGAALLLVGFFLPWFKVYALFNVQVNVMGGEVHYGLGWLILFLGLAAALAPQLATRMDPHNRWKTVLVALGIGGIMLIYLLTQNLHFVGLGLLLGLVGYALEFIGTLKQRPAMQR